MLLTPEDSKLTNKQKQLPITEISFGSLTPFEYLDAQKASSSENVMFLSNCFQADWQKKGYPASSLDFYRQVRLLLMAGFDIADYKGCGERIFLEQRWDEILISGEGIFFHPQ